MELLNRLPVLLGALCLNVWAMGLAHADTFEVQSHVAGLSIHPDGARVVRFVELDLPAGNHDMHIMDLPTRWNAASLHLELWGSEGLVLGASRLDEGEANRQILEALEALDMQIHALGLLQAELEAQAHTLRQEIALVEQLARDPVELLALENGLELWRALGEEAVRAGVSLAELRQQDEALAEEIVALEQMRQPLFERVRSRRLSVQIHAEQAGRVGLGISYFTDQASWHPTYRIALETDSGVPSGQVHLVQEAQISQNTGEDWSAVPAELSAAFVRGRTAAPYLPTAWLHEQQPQDRISLDATDEAQLGGLVAQDLSASISRLEEAEVLQAQAFATGFTSRYVLPEALSLASSREEGVRVILGEGRGEAELWVEAVAQLDTRAFLRARLRNPLEVFALPGPARLFRDGVYVGQVQLGALQPGAELELDLGQDPLVEVERFAEVRIDGDQGLVRQRNTAERSYLTRVTSRHDFPMLVRLVDRLPVATHEDIEVSLLREADAFDELDLDGRTGVGAWLVVVEPGMTLERRLAYQVTWPQDRVLSGF